MLSVPLAGWLALVGCDSGPSSVDGGAPPMDADLPADDGGPPPATIGECDVEAALTRVRTTEGGTLYHTNCTPENADGRIVVFLPGTGGEPARHCAMFTACIGDATGLCAMAIPYDNEESLIECCAEFGGIWTDPLKVRSCVETAIPSKAYGDPSTYTCTRDNGARSTTWSESIEGELTRALSDLGMSNYVDGSGETARVDWNQVYLSGHSLGGVFAHFIAITGGSAGTDTLLGVGSFGSGIERLGDGDPPYATYITTATDASRTPLSLQRSFSHVDDYLGHAELIAMYDAMGLPPENILTTADRSSWECDNRPHQCVVVDRTTPIDDGRPRFLDQWLWMVAEGPFDVDAGVREADAGRPDAGP